MIRESNRPLTGTSEARAYRAEGTVREPEVKLGRRPNAEGYLAGIYGWHGQPAVTVDLNGGRSGALTFVDPELLRKLSSELFVASQWLEEQQAGLLGVTNVEQP